MRYQLRADDGTPLIGYASLDEAIERCADLPGSDLWVRLEGGGFRRLNWDGPEGELSEATPEGSGIFGEALRHLATCLAQMPPRLLVHPEPSD